MSFANHDKPATSNLTYGTATSAAPNDHNVGPSAGNDGISSLTWSPVSNYLVSTNWDGGVRCWEVKEMIGGRIHSIPKAIACHTNQAPVLCSSFSSDGRTVFSGGADQAVRMWHLSQAPPPNGTTQQIGAHNAPVKSVGFLKATNLVVSGAWDKCLKLWDVRQHTPVRQLELPERCYDLDIQGNLMVVACAGRHIIAYDVSSQPLECLRMESPLEFQTRCVAAFPDTTGFAVGSIDGRAAIQYIREPQKKNSFPFRCHRQDTVAFAVNAICFNRFGTFASVGADGRITFWDKDSKVVLKRFEVMNRTIPCANFNSQGNMFAYACSYDWSMGSSFCPPGQPNQNEIFIHFTPDDEVRPKKKVGLR